MSDMIGLLRFGMPVTPVPVAPHADTQAHKATPAVAAVSSASGGGRAAGQYTATPRPTISPQFAYASAGDPAAPGTSGVSAVIDPPMPFDPDVLTGPPPTFEASLMQVEAHLRLSLARIDASRHAHPMDRPPLEKPKVGGTGDTGPADKADKAETAPVPAPAPHLVKAATAAGPDSKAALPAAPGARADAPRPTAGAEPAPVN